MDSKEVNEQNPQVIATTDKLELHFSLLSLVLFMKLLPLLSQMRDMPSSESRSGVISAFTAFKFLVCLNILVGRSWN